MIVRETIDRLGVVGAGTMGSGIAQVAATHGYDVVMRYIEEELVESAFENIDDSLDRLVSNETLSEDEAEGIRDRIEGTTDLEDLADCDLVVEAALEDMDVKQDVFSDLEDVCDEDVLLGRTRVRSRSPR